MGSAFTLVSFFEQYYKQLFLCDARPATFRAYDATIEHWRKITRNPDMPFGPIVLATFKVELQKSLKPATVNKHLRHINAILAKVGSAGPGNRDALGLVANIPWTKPLREDKPKPRLISDDILSRIYNAAVFMQRPRLKWCNPGNWWKALICTAVTTGFRRGVLLSLLWDDLDLVNRTIHISASIDKCHTDREKPLNQNAIRHPLQIRGRSKKLFPFTACEREWYRDWHKFQDHADIGTADHIKLHDLKRFAGTRRRRRRGSCNKCSIIRRSKLRVTTSTQRMNVEKQLTTFRCRNAF